MLRGVEAIDYFLEIWHSKIKEYDEVEELEAMVEYVLGSKKRIANTKCN